MSILLASDFVVTTEIDCVSNWRITAFVIKNIAVDDYLNLMRQLFDFDQLRQLVSSSSFKMHIDCMHGKFLCNF